MTEKSNHKGNKENQPDSSPVLVPPDASAKDEIKPSRIRLLLVFGVGLLLVLGAGAVLFFSPTKLSPPVVKPEEPQKAEISVPPAPSPGEGEGTSEDVALEASRLLGVWLRKQAEAEGLNIGAWGGEAYARAVSLARECESLLAERQVVPAREACAEAIGTLENLMGSREKLMDDALRAGFLALEQGDPKTAENHFRQALAIDAENEEALKGLRRSASLPDVLRLVEEGQTREQEGDLEGALQSISEAVTLDPDFLPAQKALSRVRTAISEQQFRQAMGSAIEALAGGKLNAAGVALKKAQALKPDDPALLDLKSQLFRARIARKMDALRRQGKNLEKKEQWPEALKVCEEALNLDSSVAFAAGCRERVSRRIELDSRLRAILSRPERLFSDGPLQEAREVLAHADRVKPRGPLLSSQIDQVEKLIRQAESEVEVVIRSDGLTDVVIYHVGRLGRFQEKKLVLRTGNYTAMGSRNGYRDVRQTLKVRPGGGTMVVTLRCEEPI
jgi:tetratricopeptide (TPR) repeat protein